MVKLSLIISTSLTSMWMYVDILVGKAIGMNFGQLKDLFQVRELGSRATMSVVRVCTPLESVFGETLTK